MNDFNVGDKIRKIEDIQDETIYEIVNIIKETGGNWHDGFYTIWSAVIRNNTNCWYCCCCEETYILKHYCRGVNTTIYAVKI
jgi:hypothetical protein